jgi:translocation protein SEC62
MYSNFLLGSYILSLAIFSDLFDSCPLKRGICFTNVFGRNILYLRFDKIRLCITVNYRICYMLFSSWGCSYVSGFDLYLQEQVFTENDGFFAWMFLKRRTLWQTILSFVWPLFALAVCLFPVYPYQCKIVVLYSCAGALLFIVSILLLRAAIFGILWVLLGKRVWFFPNINAEETTFRELVRFWPEKDEGERPKWTSRLFYALVAVLVILLLRHHAPDEAARARYQKKVSNIIDDVLEWSPKLAISGMIEKHTGANMTEASNYTSTGGSSHAPPSAEGKATEANRDTDADGDTQADSDEIQDSGYADDTRTRSNEA